MKKAIYLVLTIGMILTAGCSWYTSAPPEEATLTFEGTINASDDGFEMEGQINNIGQAQPTFENVSVYLYDQNETLIQSDPIGEFERESSHFSIQSNRLPEHIVIYSEEFWSLDSVELMYYSRANTDDIRYTEYIITSKEELPVVPGNGA